MISFIIKLIEIKSKIEDKRQFYGKKFLDFLSNIFSTTNIKIHQILSSKSGGLLISLALILTSLYKRSCVDIGQDSALYLEIAQKILDGKEYFKDFFEYNFPLSFLFLTIPIFVADFFKISPMVLADYYVNILAILSLIFSYKIVQKSNKFKNQFELNIFIICLILGFFIRPKTLVFNEFLTKSSVILIIIYPIISFHILGIDKLKIFQKIFLGFLYASLVFTKPNYAILIIVLEVYRLYKTKKISNFFDLHILYGVLFTGVYALITFINLPSFWNNFDFFIKIYNEYKHRYWFYNSNYSLWYGELKRVIIIIERQFLLYLSLFYIYFYLLRAGDLIKFLFLFALSGCLIAFTEIYYLDQLVVVYAMILPFCIFGLREFLKQYRDKINLSKNWFWYVSIIICCLIINENLGYFQSQILMQLAPILFLYILIKISKKLVFLKKFEFLLVGLLPFLVIFYDAILSLGIFAVFIWLLARNFERVKRCSNIVIILVLVSSFTLIGGYYRALFLEFFEDGNLEYKLKSPNLQNEELLKLKKNYLDKENLIIIARDISNSYPFRNYSKLINNSEFSSYDYIQTYFNGSNQDMNLGLNEKILKSFLNQLKNKNNKIIVFYKTTYCDIGFLEYFLKNQEIRQYFVKNFKYLTNFYTSETKSELYLQETKSGLNNDEYSIIKNLKFDKPAVIKNDIFEVYIRK